MGEMACAYSNLDSFAVKERRIGCKSEGKRENISHCPRSSNKVFGEGEL